MMAESISMPVNLPQYLNTFSGVIFKKFWKGQFLRVKTVVMK